MALPTRLAEILFDLEQRSRRKALSGNEKKLLAELRALNNMLRPEHFSYETRSAFSEATKMTSPGGDSCGECGRPF